MRMCLTHGYKDYIPCIIMGIVILGIIHTKMWVCIIHRSALYTAKYSNCTGMWHNQSNLFGGWVSIKNSYKRVFLVCCRILVISLCVLWDWRSLVYTFCSSFCHHQADPDSTEVMSMWKERGTEGTGTMFISEIIIDRGLLISDVSTETMKKVRHQIPRSHCKMRSSSFWPPFRRRAGRGKFLEELWGASLGLSFSQRWEGMRCALR